MFKRYKNAPIVEAICEFQFGASSPWDITLLGLIYDKLKLLFPRKEQLQDNIVVAVTSEFTQGVPLIPLIRFSDKHEKKLVQLGYNLLTINHLKPYSSWSNFLPLVESVFKSYVEIAQPQVFSTLLSGILIGLNSPLPILI